MRLIIQYFWEINNLFDLVGYGIAINEIWKYTAPDFPAELSCDDRPKSAGPKSTAIKFEFISRDLGINTQHWLDLDQGDDHSNTNQLFEHYDF